MANSGGGLFGGGYYGGGYPRYGGYGGRYGSGYHDSMFGVV